MIDKEKANDYVIQSLDWLENKIETNFTTVIIAEFEFCLGVTYPLK